MWVRIGQVNIHVREIWEYYNIRHLESYFEIHNLAISIALFAIQWVRLCLILTADKNESCFQKVNSLFKVLVSANATQNWKYPRPLVRVIQSWRLSNDLQCLWDTSNLMFKFLRRHAFSRRVITNRMKSVGLMRTGGANSCEVYLAMFPIRLYKSVYITLDDHPPTINSYTSGKCTKHKSRIWFESITTLEILFYVVVQFH